tara:strand:+ start:1062 stop:1397 length:336 start_codon:yes stop_codon:yes gene_type:complete
MKIGISVKWNEDYGYDFSEVKLLNYLKKKNFVIYSLDDFEEITLEELIKIPFVIQDYKINIFKLYEYQERTFCNINYSFLNFQNKCKKYYRDKINFYKNPKNLIHRQIFGV